MKIDSVPNKILEILKKESRLTINEIFERTKVPEHRKEYHRLCVNRLTDKKAIAKDGKNGKEYLNSLTDRTTNNIELLKQLHTVMLNKMDFTEEPNESEIKNIKNIEELIENEPTR